MMSHDLVFERLEIMLLQEKTTYSCLDYLDHYEPASASSSPLPSSRSRTHDTININSWCRQKMVNWSYQVIDFTKFRRETVAIATSYLDRFLSTRSIKAQQVMQDRKEYQLAAMTALYMAIKLHEPVIMDTHLLSSLSRGAYHAKDFGRMESDILFDLKWHLNGPTALTFMDHILALMNLKLQDGGVPFEHHFEEHVFDLDVEIDCETKECDNSHSHSHYLEQIRLAAKYQIELSTGDYGLMLVNQSLIAVAAIMNCIKDHSNHHQQHEQLLTDVLLSIVKSLNILGGSGDDDCQSTSSFSTASSFIYPNLDQMMECLSELENNNNLDIQKQQQPIVATATARPNMQQQKNQQSSPICVSTRKVVSSSI